MRKTNQDLWKWLFIILLSLNVVTAIVIFYLISDSKEVDFPEYTDGSKGEIAFEVQSNKENINTLLAHAISNNASENSLQYNIVLDEYVEFYTSIPIFNQEIQLVMTFEPEALPNGDLLLKQKSLQLGKMSLPVKYVLNFIKKQEALPEWVILDPENEQVYIALSDIEIKDDLQLQAKKIDLREDVLLFHLIIPK